MFKAINKNEKGFTLIELMIVVAIIGILAAIAIPQFSAYRIRAFNSAAVSDITNLQSSEATLFSDWTIFGGTEEALTVGAAGGGAPNAGALVTSPLLGGNIPMISGNDSSGVTRALQIGLSNGCSMVAGCSNLTSDNFTAVSKHVQGNTVYGVDSDVTMTYQNPGLVAPGTAIAVGALLAPTAAADDFAGVAGWVVK